jgi:nucleotide-binding universal stress UspA family protein
MYKQILIPLDGSEIAEQALAYATAQAEYCKGRMILLRVLEPLPRDRGIPLSALKRAEDQTSKAAREYLQRVAASMPEQCVPVEAVVREGRAHEEIIRFADEHAVDLIVLSARGSSGLSRWLLGSVADRVVRGSNKPILLIRPTV